jgi:hypothetical protein
VLKVQEAYQFFKLFRHRLFKSSKNKTAFYKPNQKLFNRIKIIKIKRIKLKKIIKVYSKITSKKAH